MFDDKFSKPFKTYLGIETVYNFLADEEVKDFVAINFSEYLKSIGEEENLQ